MLVSLAMRGKIFSLRCIWIFGDHFAPPTGIIFLISVHTHSARSPEVRITAGLSRRDESSAPAYVVALRRDVFDRRRFAPVSAVNENGGTCPKTGRGGPNETHPHNTSEHANKTTFMPNCWSSADWRARPSRLAVRFQMLPSLSGWWISRAIHRRCPVSATGAATPSNTSAGL